jgi:hypothetical protein
VTNVLRSKGDSAVFLLDQDTSECLHYEPITGYPPRNIAKIPRGILEGHPNIEVRYDLIDCSIDVCAVEVSHCRSCDTSCFTDTLAGTLSVSR